MIYTMVTSSWGKKGDATNGWKCDSMSDFDDYGLLIFKSEIFVSVVRIVFMLSWLWFMLLVMKHAWNNITLTTTQWGKT